MKTIVQSAFNYIASIPDEGQKFGAEVEVALTLAEPVYQIGNDGELHRIRTTETVRFVASVERMRFLAKSFTQAADACETNLSEALREHADAVVRQFEQRTYQANKPAQGEGA